MCILALVSYSESARVSERLRDALDSELPISLSIAILGIPVTHGYCKVLSYTGVKFRRPPWGLLQSKHAWGLPCGSGSKKENSASASERGHRLASWPPLSGSGCQVSSRRLGLVLHPPIMFLQGVASVTATNGPQRGLGEFVARNGRSAARAAFLLLQGGILQSQYNTIQ